MWKNFQELACIFIKTIYSNLLYFANSVFDKRGSGCINTAVNSDSNLFYGKNIYLNISLQQHKVWAHLAQFALILLSIWVW